MKKLVNFCLICAIILLFTGCYSWQQILSFGFYKSDEDKAKERMQNEQSALIEKCEAGDTVACNNLAVNFSEFGDHEKGKFYYEKACSGGLATACSNLGQIYEKGLADEKSDIGRALELYRLSCDSGDGVGCYNEALLAYQSAQNKKDEGKEKSMQISLSLLAKSCELEYAQACFLLAKLSNDDTRAKKLYKRACKLGKCVK